MNGENRLMDRLLGRINPELTVEELFREGFTIRCCGEHLMTTYDEFVKHEEEMRGYYENLVNPRKTIAK